MLLVAAVLAFGVLAPPEHCPDVTTADLEASATAAVDWFTRNQYDDGTWLYEYDAVKDQETGSPYNVVRHAGAVMGLYQAATAGIPGALESADRGVEWARDHLVERDGWVAVSFDGRTAVGTAALLTAGLVERRLLTGETDSDDLIRGLARFMVAQTEPSGAVLAEYDDATGQPVAGNYSKYFTGEAYWALGRVHRLFPDEGWGEAADRIGDYLATSRDEVEDHWPPVPDHWTAYGLAETVAFPERDPARPLAEDELGNAERQAALFGSQVRWVSQQAGPWGVAVRGTFSPRGGGYGVVGEALTGLWLVAEADGRLAGDRKPLAERARCIAALAIDEQRVGSEADAALRPDRVDGAWFVGDVTRMDDQQHAISALLRTIAIVEAESIIGEDDAPSGWLWLLALVATLNALYAAVGTPRRESGRERAALGALGGLVGSVIVLVVALLGDPLLDLLDVSVPAARIAVGAVAAVAALFRMVARPPSPEPALTGWRAAIIPVGIPLVASPAAVLLAIGAAADGALGVLAITLLITIGALAGLVAVLPGEGAGRVAVMWAARLVSAAAAVACVLLVIDGVLDV